MGTQKETIQSNLASLKKFIDSSKKGKQFFVGGRLSIEFLTQFTETLVNILSLLTDEIYIDIDKNTTASNKNLGFIETIQTDLGIDFTGTLNLTPEDTGKTFRFIGTTEGTVNLPYSVDFTNANGETLAEWYVTIINASTTESNLVINAAAGNLIDRTTIVNQPWQISKFIEWEYGTDWFFSMNSTPSSRIDNFFNGSFRESFDARESSSGGVVTCTLEQSGGGDLTMRFSDGETVLDCTTTPCTIALTVGTDPAPQENYIYIPISTKVLTKSTTGWPSEEHIRVSYFYCQSAADVLSDGGCYINQNWNDHLMDTTNRGHLAHIGEWIRNQPAKYFSGIDPNGTSDYLTIVAGDIRFKSTAGVISQLHKHSYLAKDTTTDIAHVVNWSGDAYHNVQNLYDIVNDSTGAAINLNRWFNIVVWGVANKTGQYDALMINLPSGDDVSQADAENDANLYSDYSIPRQYTKDSGTGFLICRITVQKRATTWAYGATKDLRGLIPANAE
jgi:hypothetical protein